MAYICVGKLTIIGSDNGLSPSRRQAIIWTNAGILLIWPLWTNFSEILIGIQAFSSQKMHLEMSSAKWRPSCLGLSMLNETTGIVAYPTLGHSFWNQRLKLNVVEWCIYTLIYAMFWSIQWPVTCAAPSHYLNQCWFIANWTLRSELYSDRNSNCIIDENAFKNRRPMYHCLNVLCF